MTNGIKKGASILLALCMTMMQCLLFPVSAAEKEPDFSILGAVGVFTEEETRILAEVIYEGLESHAETISLKEPGMPVIGVDVDSIDSLGCLYRSVVSGWDVGILTKKNTMPYRYGISGVSAIMPAYIIEDEAEYEREYAAMMELLDEAVAGVDSRWSDAEKALYIHEWMADSYNYDNTKYETTEETYLRHTAYGMLKRDIAVCEGYAWLYALLLRRVDVESIMVESTALSHAWNALYIDGAWYHVDVTWDDAYAYHPGLVSHDSFLKSNAGMEESYHTSNDWVLTSGTPVSELNVSDKYDDAFWADAISVVQPYQDGSWVAILPDMENKWVGWFTECSFDAATGQSEITRFMSLSEKWYVPGTTQYFVASYIVTDKYKGEIYYTTPHNVFMLRNNVVVWLFGLTEEQKATGNIFGMTIEGNTMHYYVSSNPNIAPTEYTADLSSYASYVDAVAGTTTTSETTTTTTTTTEETTTTSEETTTTTEETTTTSEETTTTTEETTTTSEETTTTTEETTTTSEETTTTTEETTTTSEETTTITEETTTASEETTTTTEETTTTSEETTTTTEETTTTSEETTTTTEETTTSEETTTTTEETTTTSEETTTTTEETTTSEETTTTTEETTTSEETTTTTEETTATTEPVETITYGDANGDGEVSVVDIIVMQRYLLGQMNLTKQTAKNIDFTRDGTVNAFDMALMKRALLRAREA